ncbi:MAG: TRAP transporter substrate-binding protein DctP [Burkholderiales bacterium]
MTVKRKAVPVFVAALAAFALLPFAAQGQTTLRLISGWGANNSNVPLVEAVFIKNVMEASNGQIRIQRSGPEVVPPFDQLQPVSAGVFDILFTTPNYHQAQTGVGALFDAFKSDPDKRREAGLVAWADDYYQNRFGVRILALFVAPGNHFVLRDPLGADGTLKGRKIRSIPIFDGVIRALGGTPVTLLPTDALSAMQKGVVDGIAFPSGLSADYRLYEAGKYMTRPVFGRTDLLFVMNVKKFDSLPAGHQKVLLEEGRRIEAKGQKALAEHGRRDIETMEKNGVKVTNFEARVAASIERLYNEGIFNTASKSSPNEVKTLWDMAKSKNMINE